MKKTIILSLIGFVMTFVLATTTFAENGRPSDKTKNSSSQPQKVEKKGSVNNPTQDSKENLDAARLSYGAKEKGTDNEPQSPLGTANTPPNVSQKGNEELMRSMDDDFHEYANDELAEDNNQSSETYETSRSKNKEEGSGLDWLIWLVSIGALCLAAYNYLTLHPKKNKKGTDSQQGKPVANETMQLKTIAEQNRELSAHIEGLNKRVDDLKAIVNTLSNKVSLSSSTMQQSITSSAVSRTQPEIGVQTRYATVVTSDGFSVDNLTDTNGDYVIAILSIKGDTGTFVVNNLNSAQTFLISNFAYGAGRICDIAHQSGSPSNIRTVRPGTIRLQGKAWQVTAKAQVELV